MSVLSTLKDTSDHTALHLEASESAAVTDVLLASPSAAVPGAVQLETEAVIATCTPTPAGTVSDNRVTLTFDILTSESMRAEGLPCVPSLALIAQAFSFRARTHTY